MELSDDSDIEVHPNVDKRSFIRAKQQQIHMEREKRRLRIEQLKHQRVVNEVLMRRLLVMLSSRQLQARSTSMCAGELMFEVLIQSAPCNPEEDAPPPPPEDVFDTASLPLPTYTKMISMILDEVDKKLDEQGIQGEQRYDAFAKELGAHLRTIQGLQTALTKELTELENQASTKITSESYRVGFDSSHVSKVTPGESSNSKAETKTEPLNPTYNLNNPSSPSTAEPTPNSPPKDTEQTINRPSPSALAFAQLPSTSYPALHAYLTTHPELLQPSSESDEDALLYQAYSLLSNPSPNNHKENEALARQYIHASSILKFCRVLRPGREGVEIFFRGVNTPGHKSKEVLEKDVDESFAHLKGVVKREREEERAIGGAGEVEKGVERIQLCAAGEGDTIQIWVPPVGSEDEEVRRAREMFEGLTVEVREALESGKLEEVNRVLEGIKVAEAEEVLEVLREARSTLRAHLKRTFAIPALE